jgi:AraC-like DNA-binding protein
MIREYFARLFQLAWAETRERIRQDRERCPKRFAPLFRVIEEQLFEPGFNVQAARRQSGILQGSPPLGQPLSSYLAELRIHTAQRVLELADGRVPSGWIAAAVGLGNYLTWRRTFERVTGENPPLIRLPDRLQPRFDDVTWHRACRGELPLDDAKALIERLQRFYPQGWGNVPPPAQFLGLRDLIPRPGSKGGGITEDEVREAVQRAAEKPLARLKRDAKGLPRNLLKIVEDVAEHLFDSALDVGLCRQRVGLLDTSTTTRLSFFLGDTFDDLVERRRIETAVGLIPDRRFTIERIAEEVGMTYRSFSRAFPKRTGATGSEIRKTLLATADHPAYDLWSRVEACGLSHDELRMLVAYLRGLHPEIAARHQPGQLAVRTDVDPRRVEEILQFDQAIVRESPMTAGLDTLIQTHPDYSAGHWYVHWIRDRLGRQTMESAWVEWQRANRDLGELTELPREQQSDRVRGDRRFQTDVFLWLLVDCVGVRLFQDAAESEHFADLAVAVADARWRREVTPENAGLRGLTIALKANAIQRRNKLTEASAMFTKAVSAVRTPAANPWIKARVRSLYASLLDRQGEAVQARRCLFEAGTLMKRAGDPLERLRTVIQRAPTWFATGIDPSRILTICVRRLRLFPFAEDLIQSAHVTRLLARLYLTDQLTGKHLSEIRTYRLQLPVATSSFLVANHQQIDGIIAALNGELAEGARLLRDSALWYEENRLFGYAATSWIEYSWAILELNEQQARQAALVAYDYMAGTGFNAQQQQEVAKQLLLEAERRSLNRETLRRFILLRVCPGIETRPADAADRAPKS